MIPRSEPPRTKSKVQTGNPSDPIASPFHPPLRTLILSPRLKRGSPLSLRIFGILTWETHMFGNLFPLTPLVSFLAHQRNLLRLSLHQPSGNSFDVMADIIWSTALHPQTSDTNRYRYNFHFWGAFAHRVFFKNKSDNVVSPCGTNYLVCQFFECLEDTGSS